MSIGAALRDVRVTFPGGVQALAGIDLDIGSGGTTGLVGESGSGKTTLCRVLAGLQPPSAGQAEVGGTPVGGLPVGRLGGEARRRFQRTVQMLLQDAPGSLSPRLTVGALLREPIAIHGLERVGAEARLAELLGRLGLSASMLHRYPHQLSGGQARRVAMARALMLEPRLLIADEPTAGLDLSVQGELLNLLLELRRTLDLTILVSSHNLAVIRRIADRVVVMYLGQVVEEGPTGSLFMAPGHPYTAALLSAHPSVDPARRRPRIVLRGDAPSVVAPPSGCRFHTRCFQAQPRCATDVPALEGGRERAIRCHYPLG